MRCIVDKDNIIDLLQGEPIEYLVNGTYILFQIDKDLVKYMESSISVISFLLKEINKERIE